MPPPLRRVLLSRVDPPKNPAARSVFHTVGVAGRRFPAVKVGGVLGPRKRGAQTQSRRAQPGKDGNMPLFVCFPERRVYDAADAAAAFKCHDEFLRSGWSRAASSAYHYIQVRLVGSEKDAGELFEEAAKLLAERLPQKALAFARVMHRQGAPEKRAWRPLLSSDSPFEQLRDAGAVYRRSVAPDRQDERAAEAARLIRAELRHWGLKPPTTIWQ